VVCCLVLFCLVLIILFRLLLMATVKKFEDLEIWQIARELHLQIFNLTETIPSLARDFELRDQIKRSSGSVMDNIAEGFGRSSRLEFIQFLSIAKASASEVQSQLIRSIDRKHINQETFTSLNDLALKVGNKTGAFIKYLNETDIRGQKFNNRVSNAEIIKEANTQQNNTQQNNKQQTKNTLQTTNTVQTTNTINTEGAAKPLGAYPHARKVGDLLLLSGIGSRSAKDNSIPGLELDAEGNILKYDIALETHQCFANVKAVLEASGSSWDKIIDVTVFLTNMKKDFPIYNKIYGEYFTDVQACRTTVEVKSLPTPIAIELKVIATI
jgi:2-aminomuconate deaminase